MTASQSYEFEWYFREPHVRSHPHRVGVRTSVYSMCSWDTYELLALKPSQERRKSRGENEDENEDENDGALADCNSASSNGRVKRREKRGSSKCKRRDRSGEGMEDK